jgi:hypothetical protein
MPPGETDRHLVGDSTEPTVGTPADMTQDKDNERTDAVRLPDVATEMGVDSTDPEITESSPVELAPFAALNAIAVYDTSEEAREALLSLERAGIESDRLSFLALDTSKQTLDERAAELDHEQATFVVRGTAKGGSLGTIGGAAIGGALMLIPGVGTVVGAGVLGAALGGGFMGGVVGGMWGGFNRMGESGGWDESFHHLENGKALVGVHTDDPDELRRASDVLPNDRLRVFDREGQPID